MHPLRLACLLACLLAAVPARPAQAQAQTQAQADPPALRAETLASGLQHPWGLAFLPQGRMLVTERPGRMRVVEPDGRLGPALEGLPQVAAGGQGGLLDVLADSDFARNRLLYFCYAEPAAQGRGSSTALARAQLSADGRRLQDVRVLFSQQPKVASSRHFGCRIVERRVDGRPDGSLFLTLGDRGSRADDAQTLDNHHGKIVRVGKDGSVPRDNPFVGRAGALPEIWSYGHRNVQGATLAPDGRLWTHEHGARGGDEVNRPEPGRNHGWPVITHGVDYSGAPIGAGITAKAGMEQPWHHWTPSIAPSGMAFITSARYGEAWRGSLVVGSLKFGRLHLLQAGPDGRLLRERPLLEDLGERVRDVREGPDGLLYVLTDAPDGRLLRLPAAH